MWAWQVGTVRGIALKVHATFPLVLLWAAFQFGAGRENAAAFALFGAVLVLLLFGCVLLHELGHALVALYFGIAVDEILLLPIGGLAKLRAMDDDPKQEFAIALAGPLVNVLIALLLLPLIFLLTDVLDPFLIQHVTSRTGGSEARAIALLMGSALQSISLDATLVYLFFANVMLTVFNLVPAFPMDGGRIFRALLALLLPYRWATIVAVRAGQGLALLLVLWGFRFSPGLLLVAAFVFISGGSELRRIALRDVLIRGRVHHYMMHSLQPLYPGWNLHAARLLSQQTGQRAFPVMADDKLLGLLTVREMHNQSPALTVGDVMVQDFPIVPATDTLYDAQLKLYGRDQFAAAVMQDEQLLGLLSLEDIERAYHSLQRQPKARVA